MLESLLKSFKIYEIFKSTYFEEHLRWLLLDNVLLGKFDSSLLSWGIISVLLRSCGFKLALVIFRKPLGFADIGL